MEGRRRDRRPVPPPLRRSVERRAAPLRDVLRGALRAPGDAADGLAGGPPDLGPRVAHAAVHEPLERGPGLGPPPRGRALPRQHDADAPRRRPRRRGVVVPRRAQERVRDLRAAGLDEVRRRDGRRRLGHAQEGRRGAAAGQAGERRREDLGRGRLRRGRPAPLGDRLLERLEHGARRRAPPELREDVAAPLDGCVPRRVEDVAESVELHVLCDQYREAFLPLAQVLCALRAAQ